MAADNQQSFLTDHLLFEDLSKKKDQKTDPNRRWEGTPPNRRQDEAAQPWELVARVNELINSTRDAMAQIREPAYGLVVRYEIGKIMSLFEDWLNSAAEQIYNETSRLIDDPELTT